MRLASFNVSRYRKSTFNYRDAEDSVRGLDGRTICGRRARVELSTGKSARGYRSRGGGGRGRSPNRREERCYECGNRGHFAR